MSFNWFGYDLSDFMLFSSRAYFRLFENINLQFWPLPIVFFLLSLALGYFIFNSSPLGNRIVAFILASAWLFSGWFFIWKLYVNINWAAFWFVHLFLLQGVIFLVMAVFFKGLELQRPRGILAWCMFSVYVFAILCTPTISIFLRKSFFSMEIFGMAPSPTVYVTMGLLGISKFRGKFAIHLIPILWILFSTAVTFALVHLGQYDYYIV